MLLTDNQIQMDNFKNKLKGAIMYVGGKELNFDELTAQQLFEICFANGILLDCRIL